MPDQSRIAHPKVWTLDKSVPLAFLFGLFLQTFMMGWWTSNQATRLEASEKALLVMNARVEGIQNDMQSRSDRTAATLQAISERTIRVESAVDAQRLLIEQIARRVDVGAPKQN